ncbi:MAG: hypothetical protein EXS09_10975 [Gemmataceae bacterium]|nr:hypothetical protein [Gemmataceae bacterium]
MPTNWRVYLKDTVAARLDRSDLPGFFGKKIVINPTEAALVLRDGEPHELLTETHMRAGTLFNQIKALFGGGVDLSVYFIDLAPFDFTIFLGEQKTKTESKGFEARTFLEEERIREVTRMRQGDSPERQSWRLKQTVEWVARKIGWLDSPELQEMEGEQQSSSSITVQTDVSQVHLVAMSTDGEIIHAACHMSLRADPEKIANLAGLLKGKKAIATWDVAALVRDQLLARVLVPEIAQHSAGTLRGDRELLKTIEAKTREELATTLSNFGLIICTCSINWGLSEEEIKLRREEREEIAREFAHKRDMAHLMREQEVAKTKLATLQELKKMAAFDEVGRDVEEQELLLVSLLERNLLRKNQVLDFAKVDAQVRSTNKNNTLDLTRIEAQICEITLQLAKNEALVKLEVQRAKEEQELELQDKRFWKGNVARLAEIETNDKSMWSKLRVKIEMDTRKHELDQAALRQDREHQHEQRKLKLEESMARMKMMERLVSQGLSTGQADASVLNTMLQQATEQEYATTNNEMVKARAQAQAAGKSLDAYRAAQADERGHQRESTKLATDMMEGAKQSPAGVIVPGGFVPGTVNPQQTIFLQPPSAPQTPAPETAKCRNSGCQKEIQAKMKFCPFCGIQTSTPSL